MSFKIIVLAALAAFTTAAVSPAHYSSPVYQSQATEAASPVYTAPNAPVYAKSAPVYSKSAPVYTKSGPEPYDANPQYNFAYEVNDEHTGDVKSQQESRDGDVVKGYYTFIESDGARRIVEYTSDPEHGFNAVVHREEGAAKPTAPVAGLGYAKAPVYASVAQAAAPQYSEQGYRH